MIRTTNLLIVSALIVAFAMLTTSALADALQSLSKYPIFQVIPHYLEATQMTQKTMDGLLQIPLVLELTET